MKKIIKAFSCIVLSLALVLPGMAQKSHPVTKDKKIRIALCGIQEEVNTFATETMGLTKITGNQATGFQKFQGEELIKAFKGTATWPGGWVDAFIAAPGVEFIPAPLYQYGAGSTIEGAAYQQMKKEILESLNAAMPLDGVAIQMHGAAVAEGIDDVEDDLIAAIRQLVGPNVKLVTALDHHANMTDDSFKPMDFITIVKHYPHIDMHESSARAAKMLIDMINGTAKPYGYFERLPMIMQCFSTMDGNLYAPIRKKVEEIAKREDVYEFSLAYGFPFADVPYTSPVINVWANSPELAEKTAKEAAALLWKNRERFVAKTISAEEAVRQALETLVKQGRILPEDIRPVLIEESGALLSDSRPGDGSYGFLPDAKSPGPVIIAEKSDNPGGGAPGDATNVLKELIKFKVKQAAVCAIRDPETVQKAVKAGVGAVIDVELGGKLSKQGGAPIKGKAYVKSISDGRYTLVSPMGAGATLDMGPAVGLQIAGVDVAVISGMMQAFDASQMKILGFDPRDYRIVVVKSANHFRAWWPSVASEIIDCDPPGIASNDLSTFTFKKKTRKIFPLDKDAVYPEKTK
jgi:microcystin degradation protein MlrC